MKTYPDSIFKHDVEQVHISNCTQKWVQDNVSKFLASVQHDCNPLDYYFIRTYLESKACATFHQIWEDLQAAINKAWRMQEQIEDPLFFVHFNYHLLDN